MLTYALPRAKLSYGLDYLQINLVGGMLSQKPDSHRLN
jgi:hypothetical protein